jgi:hypothetical protein
MVKFKKAYTNTYWVTFEDRKAGCIECDPHEEPLVVASEFGQIRTIDSLPYPASPVLRRQPNPGPYGHCPEFCYAPAQCKGCTACPQDYACSE